MWQRDNLRIQDGPALGEPVAVWQRAFGSALLVGTSPGPPPGYRLLLTLTLEGVTLSGTATSEQPVVVKPLWTPTRCIFGD